jgi:hypothetical protein
MYADKRKGTSPKDETALLENREFSYRELKHITNSFSQEIGKGGFGAVFLGYLENGNPVAVKVRSESSSQGGKEFLAEVSGNQFKEDFHSCSPIKYLCFHRQSCT